VDLNVDFEGISGIVTSMSSLQVIEEIKRLTPDEQKRVFEFARYAEKEQLSPEELGDVLRKMVEANDPLEKERLKAEFVRGFYGNEPHA
jgi:hypothetical protein